MIEFQGDESLLRRLVVNRYLLVPNAKGNDLAQRDMVIECLRQSETNININKKMAAFYSYSSFYSGRCIWKFTGRKQTDRRMLTDETMKLPWYGHMFYIFHVWYNEINVGKN